MIRVVLSVEALREITLRVMEKIQKELEIQNSLGCLDNYLTSIHCSEFVANYNTSFIPREAKIAVFGCSKLSVNNLELVAKKAGINPSRIEFHMDYEKNKRFNFSRFKDSFIYSDIIFGPSSHKSVGIDGYSSAIAMMENESEHFPKITRAIANDELKITKSSFEKALLSTQLYMSLV